MTRQFYDGSTGAQFLAPQREISEGSMGEPLLKQALAAADGIDLLQDSMSLRRRTAEILRELVAATRAAPPQCDADLTGLAISASEIACYHYPEDTPEHRWKREAFIAGALYNSLSPVQEVQQPKGEDLPPPAPTAEWEEQALDIETLLALLNPLHGELDRQTYDEKVSLCFDAPRDHEYAVTVTAQMERDLTQAVCILENRLPALSRSSTGSEEACAKCGCETKGEAALVGGEIWCHPCADKAPSTGNGDAS